MLWMSRRTSFWFAALLPLAAALAQTDLALSVTPREVTRIRLPDEAGAQEHVFSLSFPATFRNRTRQPVFVADVADLTRIEVRSAAGEWKTASTSTTVHRTGGLDRIPACDQVKPGREFRFSRLGGLFAVAKDRPPSGAVTIRFHFFTECMANGAVHRTTLVTNPFSFDYATGAPATRRPEQFEKE